MNELPNSALNKLAGAVQSAEHPDADLLTAFCESVLNGAERERMVAHLAVCPQCREVVALAMPEELSLAAPTAQAGTTALLRSVVLRWAALAACVLVVVAVVATWKGMHSVAPPEAAKLESPATARNENEPAPQPHTPAVLAPAPETDKAKIGPALAMPKGATRSGALRVPMSPKQEQEIGGLGSAKTAAVPARNLGGQQTIPAQQQPNEIADLQVAQPAAPALVAKADNFSVTRTSPQQQRARSQQGGLQQNAANNQQQMMRAQALPAPPVMEQLEVGNAEQRKPEAQAETLQIMGGTSRLHRKTALVSPRWSVTNEGQLQRSMDGRMWQQVQPVAGAVVHCVASLGPEVWAGGEDGTIYYSRDAGRRWTKVKTAATGDVIGIAFSDSTHGTFTTSDGDRWVSGDGGRNWTKQQP